MRYNSWVKHCFDLLWVHSNLTSNRFSVYSLLFCTEGSSETVLPLSSHQISVITCLWHSTLQQNSQMKHFFDQRALWVCSLNIHCHIQEALAAMPQHRHCASASCTTKLTESRQKTQSQAIKLHQWCAKIKWFYIIWNMWIILPCQMSGCSSVMLLWPIPATCIFILSSANEYAVAFNHY